mmetsp:Transcript_45804/g.104975  ORF Transcript_45804/g.104975 Transcript_45804/m.104975 type:complete len:143 (-) Transcript_45804:136-564(-)
MRRCAPRTLTFGTEFNGETVHKGSGALWISSVQRISVQRIGVALYSYVQDACGLGLYSTPGNCFHQQRWLALRRTPRVPANAVAVEQCHTGHTCEATDRNSFWGLLGTHQRGAQAKRKLHQDFRYKMTHQGFRCKMRAGLRR